MLHGIPKLHRSGWKEKTPERGGDVSVAPANKTCHRRKPGRSDFAKQKPSDVSDYRYCAPGNTQFVSLTFPPKRLNGHHGSPSDQTRHMQEPA